MASRPLRIAVTGWAILALALAGCACRPAPTPTPTAPPPTARATSTPVPPAPTLTPQPTSTPLPPTATATARPTGTPLAPTATPPPAATATLSTEQLALKLAGQVSPERLMDDVAWLADDARRGRLSGSPEEDVVGAWLVQRFRDLGARPFAEAGLDSYLLPFSVPAVSRYGRIAGGDTARAENVIAVLPGSLQPDQYVCIGAHYDHIGVRADGQVNNGADDDATGVAAVLEAARLLSAAGVQPQKSLVFVCFSGEELGALGAAALCDQLALKGLSSRVSLLNMEVLGAKKGAGTFLDLWDQGVPSTGPLAAAVQAAGQQLGVRVERRGRDPGSDALRLVQQCSVPAVSIDVAWSSENHPHYHRPSDDADQIDVEGFANSVRVAVAALWLLANQPSPS